jgi:cytochrome c biogenesis protein CcmG, thiol:disulfide interchange protein DsbE
MPSPRLRAAAALAAALILAAPAAARADLKVGDRAAELVKVVGRDGKKLSLKQWQGRVVVLTFGASWCAPCKKELPAYEKLAAGYAARGAKVSFLAINIDSERAKGEAFVDQAGLKHVAAGFDPAKSSVDSYDPPKMPTTFVLRGGVVRHVHAGYAAGDEKKLAVVIDRELARL